MKISRILLCINVHRVLLLALHFGLIFMGYTVYTTASEFQNDMESLREIIGKVDFPPVFLKAIGGIIIATAGLIGVPGLFIGSRFALKIDFLLLAATSGLLALFLCVIYSGAETNTIEEANKRYIDAFALALQQDAASMDFIETIETSLECCGVRSHKDYKAGVSDSCCIQGRPPCSNKNVYQVGCTNAIEQLLADILYRLLNSLSIVIIYVLLLIVYLSFFNMLLRKKENRAKKKQLMNLALYKPKEESITDDKV